eukprot:SAG25_NODE_1334_length_3275_cov_2.165617_1_plen_34_part_10
MLLATITQAGSSGVAPIIAPMMALVDAMAAMMFP